MPWASVRFVQYKEVRLNWLSRSICLSTRMAPLSQEQIDKEFAAQLSLLDSQRKAKDIVNEGEYSEDDLDMLLAMAISIEERSNSSKPSSSTGSTHQNQVVSDTGDDESDDVVPAVAEGAAGSSSNRSVGRNAGKNVDRST